jgi:hypothetical protein
VIGGVELKMNLANIEEILIWINPTNAIDIKIFVGASLSFGN